MPDAADVSAALEVTATEATCDSDDLSAGALAKADPAFLIGGRGESESCPRESRAAKPPRRDELFAARTLEAREKVAPVGTGSFMFTPANRRKGHAGFPCRRRHRKLFTPLAIWRFAPPCAPKTPCATSCLWRSFLTRGTSGADCLAPGSPAGVAPTFADSGCHATSLRRPRGCGSNSLSKPGRKWGLGKRIALSFCLAGRCSLCHSIT